MIVVSQEREIKLTIGSSSIASGSSGSFSAAATELLLERFRPFEGDWGRFSTCSLLGH